MSKLTELLHHYGVVLVFANVLLEQAGLPIPAFPLLIVAGALSMTADLSWGACMLVSVLACLIADLGWYGAGLRHGNRVLGLLCRISLSPDTCVSQTEDKFRRWGAKSLVISKFIPGFNVLAAPLAGAIGTTRGRFLFYSGLGSLLWVNTGIAIGALFHSSIDAVLDILSTMGSTALVIVLALLVLFVLFKYVERQRLYRKLRMARITVPELRDLMAAGHEPVVIDVRSRMANELDAAIPGAIVFRDPAHAPLLRALPRDREIIVYCNCPNEATAAQIARQLLADGFVRVRPLIGGLDAWNASAG